MAVLLYATLTTASGPSDRPQGANRIWQYYCMLHSPEPMTPQIGPRVVNLQSVPVHVTHFIEDVLPFLLLYTVVGLNVQCTRWLYNLKHLQ